MIKLHFDACGGALSEALKYFRIRALAHVFGRPDWFYNFHQHDVDAEIIFIAAGNGAYMLDSTVYPIEAGDLLLINPGVVHGLASDAHHALDVWTLSLTGLALPGLTPNHIIKPYAMPVAASGEQSLFLRAAMEQLYVQHETKAAYAVEAAHALAVSILLLARQLARQEAAVGTLPAHNALALQALAYINTHYREPLTLESLAASFHTSPGQLSHALTAECGASPANYIASRRVSEAQALLLHTSLPVEDIARTVGYLVPADFERDFVRRIGMKPADFRAAAQAP